MINKFRQLQYNKVALLSLDFERYLTKEIDWSDRLICIMGARGSGKTTMILQYIKKNFNKNLEALYISLDDFWFTNHSLTEIAEQFVIDGGTHLYLDEVHKYPSWSVEIKNLYDNYPNLHIVFSGSSILQIYKGYGDLSRRVSKYELEGLSFREYLAFEHKLSLPVISLNDILTNHTNIAAEYSKHMRLIPAFRSYLKEGYYPFFKESKKQYFNRLLAILHVVLETDIPIIENIQTINNFKLKKLLGFISEAVPYKPNITKLSEQIDSNRITVLNFIDMLSRAKIVNNLKEKSKSDSVLAKPEKLFMHNTNLMYALCETEPNVGSLRETFFFNQAKVLNSVHYTQDGDFLINKKITIEVGGKNKSFDQIAKTSDSYIAADEIEIGFGNKIPLWLWGFMY